MDLLLDFLGRIVGQLQGPTLAFLLGGALASALGSKLQIPNQVYQLTVFILLMRVGMGGGAAILKAQLSEVYLPALFAAIIGVLIVVLGLGYFSLLPKVKKSDGLATAGLFGAVSSATLAAAMLHLEKEGIAFEGWVPALYPFMDIPALISAILLAQWHEQRSQPLKNQQGAWHLIKDSLRGSAVTALLLGVALGLFAKADNVYKEFYDKLFPGFLSILMVALGIDAWQRIKELKSVAGWFALYAVAAPIVHGFIGFFFGYLAHLLVGLSPGGTIILAILAASNSDISGPPTLRAGIPQANPSAYIGSSTGIGTPVAIAICIPLFVGLAKIVFPSLQ